MAAPGMVDPRGLVVADRRDVGSAREAALQVCGDLQPLLGSIVALADLQLTRVSGQRTVALAMVDEIDATGRLSRVGFATDPSPVLAARLAVLDAVAPDGDLVAAGVSRLAGAGVIGAAIIGDLDGERLAVGDPEPLSRLRRLMLVLRQPGRLAVHTRTTTFRVVFTGALDLGLLIPDPRQAPEVDAWLDGLVGVLPHGQVDM